jgi:hypothetical protein
LGNIGECENQINQSINQSINDELPFVTKDADLEFISLVMIVNRNKDDEMTGRDRRHHLAKLRESRAENIRAHFASSGRERLGHVAIVIRREEEKE